jgi:ribosomal protein L7/L12
MNMHQLDRIEEGVTKLLAGLPNNPDFLSRATAAAQVTEMFTAIISNRKIEAIKMHRKITGMGLKESKDAIEALLGAVERRAKGIAA